MTTSELINDLRDWAEVEGPGSLAAILNEAADRLEELDERLAIQATEGELPHHTIYVSPDGTVPVTVYKGEADEPVAVEGD